MGKRLLTAILALCLALLPAHALAADRPASTDYWIDMTTAEARQMLHAVADGSESRYIVFVYYGTDSTSITASNQFSSHANKNKCPIYNYAYTGGAGGESLANELAALFGGTAPTTLPVAVTFNPSTGKCMARENVPTLSGSPLLPEINGLLDLMKENGVSSGSTTTVVPDTPPVDPGTPDLPNYSNGSTSIPNVHEQAWEVLRLVNQHRMSLNLQPLSVFNELQQAANLRAVELHRYFSHTRPDGSDFSTVFTQMGIAMTSGAENIASGQRDGADAMSSWLNSSGHRANIENPQRVHLGVGYYYNSSSPSAAASNWVQNFVACSDCSFSNLRLSSDFIMGSLGADLEDLLAAADIEVTATCYRHGLCSLPLIAAMCSGYHADAVGDQTLTVSYGGQTALLTVHTHTWDNGAETTAASCAETGRLTYTCPQCGETKEETIPALGHSFPAVGEGEYVCENGCGTVVPAELARAYEALRRGAALWSAAAGTAKDVVEAYLKEHAEAVMQAYGADYICDILDGKFIDDNTKYEYRIGIRRPSSARLLSQEYDLITEPLILILKFAEPENPVRPPAVLPILPTVVPEESAETYSVSVPKVTGGQVSVSPRRAERGETVTISVEPDSGYILGTLEVTDARGHEIALRDLGEGKYSFSMPAARVTIDAAFEKAEDGGESPSDPSPDSSETLPNPAQMAFTDVQSWDWFYDSVEYVWNHNLMNGVSDTRFAPDETVSRAMIWTILARMHGVSTEIFPDAPWYEQGMQWAVQQNVSDGTNPMDSVTREQLAAMLWRNAGSPGAEADLSGYADGGAVSDYARSAMLWAVESGIMQGADGTLNPGGTASRAEAAAMIARYAGRNG